MKNATNQNLSSLGFKNPLICQRRQGKLAFYTTDVAMARTCLDRLNLDNITVEKKKTGVLVSGKPPATRISVRRGDGMDMDIFFDGLKIGAIYPKIGKYFLYIGYYANPDLVGEKIYGFYPTRKEAFVALLAKIQVFGV